MSAPPLWYGVLSRHQANRSWWRWMARSCCAKISFWARATLKKNVCLYMTMIHPILHVIHAIFCRDVASLGRSDPWKVGGPCTENASTTEGRDGGQGRSYTKLTRKSKDPINYNLPWKLPLRFMKYDWIISETSPYDIPAKSAIFHLHRFRTVSTLKSPLFSAKPHSSPFWWCGSTSSELEIIQSSNAYYVLTIL